MGLDPGGGALVHMRDQRFSKHTLNATSSFQEKHPLNKNLRDFALKFTPKQAFFFGGGTFLVQFQKMTPKRPLLESKRTLFSKIGTF